VGSELTLRVVLLVEDNPADADLVSEMLNTIKGDRYRFSVVHARRMSEAIDRFGDAPIDIVLLDLGLPDAAGVEALTTLQMRAGRTPIVVLTGHNDDALALDCIALGAQDYLAKADIRPVSLRRSINYAINRSYEHELRELRDTIGRYREMSSTAGQPEALQAAGEAVRSRLPDAFAVLVEAYACLLRRHFDRLVVRVDKPREEMTRIATELGQRGAGARDLVDIHVAALSQLVESGNGVRARALAVEGRLVALEVMGLLVDYYRVRKTSDIR
jgi:CheY-like chemotaxis protein